MSSFERHIRPSGHTAMLSHESIGGRLKGGPLARIQRDNVVHDCTRCLTATGDYTFDNPCRNRAMMRAWIGVASSSAQDSLSLSGYCRSWVCKCPRQWRGRALCLEC